MKQKKPRNVLAKHPLLKKGGVHKKTYKAIRQQEKAKIKKEWLSINLFKLSNLLNKHSLLNSPQHNALLIHL